MPSSLYVLPAARESLAALAGSESCFGDLSVAVARALGRS
jgi:hypothetical protein